MKKKIPRASLQQEKARRSYLQRHHSSKACTPPVKKRRVKSPKPGVQASQPTPKQPLVTTPNQFTPFTMVPAPTCLGVDMQTMESRLTILEDHMSDAFKTLNELNENQRRMGNHIQGLIKTANQQYRDLKFHVAVFDHLRNVVNRQHTRIQDMDDVLDAHEDKLQELKHDPTTDTNETFKYDIEEGIGTSGFLDSPKNDVINNWLPTVGPDTTAAPYSPAPGKYCDSTVYDPADPPSSEHAPESPSGKPDISGNPQTQTAAVPAPAPALAPQQQAPQPSGQSAWPCPATFDPQTSQPMPRAGRGGGAVDPATAQSGSRPFVGL